MIPTSSFLRRKLTMLAKRDPILVGWLRLITKKNADIENSMPSVTDLQNTHALNTKAREKTKYPTLPIWLQKL